jgi:hypothetical protein
MSRYELPSTPFIDEVIKPAERKAAKDYAEATQELDRLKEQRMRDIIEQKGLSSAEPTDVTPSIYRGTQQ